MKLISAASTGTGSLLNTERLNSDRDETSTREV